VTGFIPDGWYSLPLEQVAEIHDSLREPVNAKERANRVGPYPYYGATGQVGWIDGYRQDGEYVLLGEDGAPFLDPTKAKAYLVQGKCWVNNHAHVLRAKEGVCINKYLLYTLNAADYRGYANGTTRLKLTQAAMKQMPIPLAPYAQQSQIVAKLDEVFSDLDAGVANLERAQVNLKRYRSAVLTAAVGGHLTAEWRNQNSPTETGEQNLARILKERRAKWEADQLAKQGKIPPKGWQSKYVEPASPDTTELPELPVGWRWMSLRQITEPIQHSVKAGPFGSALKKEFFTPDGYKVYGQEQVIRGDAYYGDYFIDEEKYQELQSCRVKPGDLLISLVGTIGRTLVLPSDAMPGIINPRLIKLTLAPNVVSPEFIQLYFASPFVKSIFKLASHGGTMEILNMGILEALPFPIPPLDEQRQIVLGAEDVTSNIMRTEEEITSQLSKAASLRQAILKSAFSGKLLEGSIPNPATSEAAA
jgi:type I restriction enzyme S subunit